MTNKRKENRCGLSFMKRTVFDVSEKLVAVHLHDWDTITLISPAGARTFGLEELEDLLIGKRADQHRN